MIKIKQHQQKWRISIENEEFEFSTRKEMEAILKLLLDTKEKSGNLRGSDF
jgi:hypothetical protein